MGYTHYFTFNEKRGNADKTEKVYQRAIKDCQKIVKTFYEECGGLSGYSAHTPVGKYGGLCVNGKQPDDCEPLQLREHFRENESFNFVKTNRYYYDIVIIACLSVLKHRLKDVMDVSTDGTNADWELGVKYARKVTKLKIKNPISKG